MAPPAKRRKRSAAYESDGEDEDVSRQNMSNTLKRYLFSSPDSKPSGDPANGERDGTVSPSPLRKKSALSLNQSQAVTLTSPSGGKSRLPKGSTKSPSTSPEKASSRAQKRVKTEEKGKTADLLTLFSKQAQKSNGNGRTNGKDFDIQDAVSDPISEDDEVALHKTAGSSIVGKNAQKRFKEAPMPGSVGPSTSSQRFLRPPRPGATSNPDDDLRPWSERFAPINLDELAVHKKKVADVRKWLDDVLGGRMRQRLLILKGAAGTGKTTTMQLLSKDMHFEVLEWRSPAGSLGATQGYQSASAQFEEFLGRGGKFGQLDMDSDSDTAPARTTSMPKTHMGRKIILIEEFPNTFMRSGSALTSFRSTVLQFLAANTPSLAAFGQQQTPGSITPIVMIISETLLTTTSASADSFTAHRLLGPEILRHPGTGVIEFNAIAPSLLAKALELVVQKEARKSGRRRTPGPLVLKRLGEIGDIRNAVASLEFLCLKGDEDADWGSKVAFSKPKRGSKDTVALTKGEQESLELISQREASLGIFHAVGKVVYNKRDELPFPDGSTEASVETLPQHVAHHSRPRRSQVALDTLIDETGTDTHTFISALHENYILSCERPSSEEYPTAIDYINDCIEYLSESDLLCPSWDIFFGGRGFTSNSFGRDIGSHVLRQDEMAFEVAVRGLLFSLPYPVKRQASHGGRGSDAFKMFYPTSLKLWRAREEVESNVDMWATKMLQGELGATASTASRGLSSLTNGSTAFRRAGDGASKQKTSSTSSGVAPKPEATQDSSTTSLSLGNAARKEMLLERLPYMAHVARRRRCTFGPMGLKDLDKIVTFQGIGGPQTEDSSDEQDEGGAPAGESWATDKPTDEASPQKKKSLGAFLSSSRTKAEGSVTASLPMQSLVLSDDDIEDD
jgi:cell cycle checkpoint protein